MYDPITPTVTPATNTNKLTHKVNGKTSINLSIPETSCPFKLV